MQTLYPKVKLISLEKEQFQEGEGNVEIASTPLKLPDITGSRIPRFSLSPPSTPRPATHQASYEGGVLQRITSKRRTKHNVCFQEWHFHLADISQVFEPQILTCCQETANVIEQSWNVENETILAISQVSDDQLVGSREHLLSREELEFEARKREEAILALENRLNEIEEERTVKIKEAFNRMSDYLNKYSHLSHGELHVTFINEIMRVNSELLTNRRDIATLIRNLRLNEVVGRRRTEVAWNDHRSRWQEVNTGKCLDKFKSSMISDDIRYPKSVRDLLSQLASKHVEFESRQRDLLENLSDSMVPPDFTQVYLQQWIKSAYELFSSWDQTDQEYLRLIYKAYEDHSQRCIDQLKELQRHLVEREFVDTSKQAAQLLEKRCLSILGELQEQFEQNLNYLDQCFAWSAYANLHAFSNPVYQFGLLIAEFWKEVGAKPMEDWHQALLKTLEDSRENYGAVVREKNDQLNMAIDSLRQSSTEEQVNERLNEVLRLLNAIQKVYETQLAKQMETIEIYPDSIYELINSYETVCWHIFGVTPITTPKIPTRSAAKDPGSKTIRIQIPTQSSDQTPSGVDKRISPHKKFHNLPNYRYFSMKSRQDAIDDICAIATAETRAVKEVAPQINRQFLQSLPSRITATGIVGEEIPTDMSEPPTIEKSTLKKKGKSRGETSSPIIVRVGTESTINVDQFICDFIQPGKKETYEAVITHLKRSVCENFLAHLEGWRIKVAEDARSEANLLREEVAAEYEFQMSLHEPRIRRSREVDNHECDVSPCVFALSMIALKDVANVRLTELSLHQTRIERHIDAVRILLSDLRTCTKSDLIPKLDDLHIVMGKEVRAAIQAKMTQATKSSMLKALRNQVERITQNHMAKVREELRSFRQKIEEKVQTLRNSNDALMDAMKLFSDGGNFAVDEARRFRTRLTELTQQITSAEEDVSGSLESIERDQRNMVDACIKSFEHDLRYHMTDVIYAENIVRCATNAATQLKCFVQDSTSQKKRIKSELCKMESLLKKMAEYSAVRESIIAKTEQDIFQRICLSNSAPSSPDSGIEVQPVWGQEEKRLQHKIITQVLDLLASICDSAMGRCVFLNCLRTQTEPGEEETTTLKNRPAVGAKFTARSESKTTNRQDHGSHAKRTGLGEYSPVKSNQTRIDSSRFNSGIFVTSTRISKPGKLLSDDACLQVVQSIFKEQIFANEKNDFMKVEQNEPSGNEVTADERTESNPQTEGKKSGSEKVSPEHGIESGPRRRHGKESQERSENSSSAGHRVQKTSNRPAPTTRTGEQKQSGKRGKGGAHPSQAKVAVKHKNVESYYDAFGKMPGESEKLAEQFTLIGRVRQVCRDNLHGMLRLSELYYRQKGLRRPTRPELIPTTFDEAASALVSTLSKYYHELEDYKNRSIQVFSSQLNRLEDLASKLPPLFMAQLTDETKLQLFEELTEVNVKAAPEMQKLTELRWKHISQLRTYPGTQWRKDYLDNLQTAETERQSRFIRFCNGLFKMRSRILVRARRRFHRYISALTDELFVRFDRLMCQDDIEEVDLNVSSYTVSDMIALKFADSVLSADSSESKRSDDKTADMKETDRGVRPTRGKKTWYGVDESDFDSSSHDSRLSSGQPVSSIDDILSKQPKKRTGTGEKSAFAVGSSRTQNSSEEAKALGNNGYCLVTAKTSAAHMATLQSRDVAVQDFRKFCTALLEKIRKEFEDTNKDNQTWQKEWSESISALERL
ncbi:unnamed protein product [Calicophoron daubneyi]|uniref:Uncharacterized protein n=1 Tax=Calicophoron daubneyi TaxID=300641 RepID=A0AAV2SWF6_CALDB